jgi:hypothetical protein
MAVGMLLAAAGVHAQGNPDWTTPIAPFRIAGNLYYVGSRDLASYLIVYSRWGRSLGILPCLKTRDSYGVMRE